MTINEAKAIDMVSYLSAIGHEPAKVIGVNYWYFSPFRTEKTASFKINRALNKWYDFGEGKGGDLLNLIVRLKGGDITDALQQLEAFGPVPTPVPSPALPTSVIEVLSVHLISSFPLVQYCDARRIPDNIADQYLNEVRYKNKDRVFYALGFSNDAGGYELRAPNFKGGSMPKSPTSFTHGATELAVFEGFFDFLSYLTILEHQEAPQRDFLVLNSTAFFEQQLPIMQAYQQVHLYLDNDGTGDKCTALATQLNEQQFIDERSLYAGYKDLNDWLMHVGNAAHP